MDPGALYAGLFRLSAFKARGQAVVMHGFLLLCMSASLRETHIQNEGSTEMDFLIANACALPYPPSPALQATRVPHAGAVAQRPLRERVCDRHHVALLHALRDAAKVRGRLAYRKGMGSCKGTALRVSLGAYHGRHGSARDLNLLHLTILVRHIMPPFPPAALRARHLCGELLDQKCVPSLPLALFLSVLRRRNCIGKS